MHVQIISEGPDVEEKVTSLFDDQVLARYSL